MNALLAWPAALRRLLRLRTLDMYVATRFLSLFVADLFIFCLLYVLIDSLSQIDTFIRRSDGILDGVGFALLYYYYELPGLFCQILGPVTTMASAMFAVTLTQRANELVPIMATGTSLQRTFFPILVLAGLITAGSLWLQEIWIPSHRNEIRASQAIGGSKDEIRHALYADPVKNVMVMAQVFHPLSQTAEGLLIYSLRGGAAMSFLINASSARWQPADPQEDIEGDWLLEDVQLQTYHLTGQRSFPLSAPTGPAPPVSSQPAGGGASGGPDRDADEARSRGLVRDLESRHYRPSESFDRVMLRELLRTRLGQGPDLKLTPSDLEVASSQDMYSTLAEIHHKIDTAPDRHLWRVKYYSRLSDPLQHLILLLLGIPVILWQGSRNVFLSALVAVALSAACFVVQSILIYLGNQGFLSPALAVWLGPIVFGSLGVTLYREMTT